MRTYYAIYVYYYTFDITWIAFYGWIWTALEADLAVICASAPALKVFFRRYFNLSANRSGNSSNSNGIKTPTFGSWGKITPGNSDAVSNMDSGKWDDSVPLDQIQVSRNMDVTVEDRRDSDSSTNKLTAQPPTLPSDGSAEWVEGCRTVCTASRPNTSGSSKNKSRNEDIGKAS